MEKAYKTINKLATTVLRGTRDSSLFCHFVFTRQIIIWKSRCYRSISSWKKWRVQTKKVNRISTKYRWPYYFFFRSSLVYEALQTKYNPKTSRPQNFRIPRTAPFCPLMALWRHCTPNMSVPLQRDIVLFSYDTRPKGNAFARRPRIRRPAAQ